VKSGSGLGTKNIWCSLSLCFPSICEKALNSIQPHTIQSQHVISHFFGQMAREGDKVLTQIL